MKATKSKYLKNKKALDFSWGLFMIAPTMIGLFLLNIFPIFQTFYLSLTKTGTFGKSRFITSYSCTSKFKNKRKDNLQNIIFPASSFGPCSSCDGMALVV